MLFGDDMFDVENKEIVVVFVNPAVFTAVARPRTNASKCNPKKEDKQREMDVKSSSPTSCRCNTNGACCTDDNG